MKNTVIDEEKPKQVSCYFNEAIKIALEKESVQFKAQDSAGTRSSINKNAIFIFEEFINKYSSKPESIKDLIEVSFDVKIKNINQKELMRILDVDYIQYPLKLTKSFQSKLNEFREWCNKSIGFKLGKRSFYNFILLTYYIQNRVEIAKREIDFWSQHFDAGSPSNFEDVMGMFNKMITT